jgi:magnesium transporter
VASFYGMNVRLPLADHPYAFLFVIGLSFVLSSAAVFYFVKRRWLEP